MKKTIVFSAALLISSFVLVGIDMNDTIAESKKKAFIISHFHCDPVWTNTQAGEILRSFSIVHQQLEYAEQEPRFKFILSEIDYLKAYWDAYPQARARILKLAKEGRIEFTGGYCEPDEAEVSGEGLIRNFAYGKIFKESFFGTTVLTAAQHDVFGHTVDLPQILIGTGHRYAQFSRGNMTDMPMEFYWLSPDGSKILTKQIGYGGSASDASFMAGDSSFYGLTRNGMFMSGGDFAEPDRSIGFRLKNTKSYEILSGTHIDFFRSLEKDLDDKGIVAPEISRDHTPLLVGCYTSRIDTKWANRRGENLLAEAEVFSTFNSLLTGAPYPWLELDKAWRLLMFGQHHDALPGTSQENVNLDLLAGYHEAATLAQTALDRSLDGIAENIDTRSAAPKSGAPIPLVVFNSLNWDRTDPSELTVEFPKPVNAFEVVDGKGQQALFQLKSSAEKPPFSSARILVAPPVVPQTGYLVLYVVAADSFPEGAVPTKTKGTVLENGLYRIEVDPARGGGIKSLYSKKPNREFIDSSVGLGNEIFSIKENGQKVESPWSLHTTGQFWRTGDYPATEISIESGAVCSRMIVRNAPHTEKAKIYDSSDKLIDTVDEQVLPELVQEIVIYNNNPRIDFATNMNGYNAKDILFKVGFPAALPGTTPVFEERFSAVTREANTENFLFYDFWREPGIKRGREYPAYNWIDLSAAASFTFKDEAGNTVSQYPLYLGEIVVPNDPAVKRIANRLAEALASLGVTTTPTGDFEKRTNEYYGFRITLGCGGNNKYTGKLKNAMDAGQKDNLDKSVADKGSGMLFVNNPESVTDTPDHRPIPILIVEGRSVEELEKLVDEMIGRIKSSYEIILPASANATDFNRKQSGFGMALINSGNPGNSVERNGTMTLSLMRSSTGWPSGLGYTSNWQVEHWNHRFVYSLLPHENDWLDAGVSRAGYEFNFPLTSMAVGLHKGNLPPRGNSFMKVDGANVIVTAVKPAGFPIIDGIGDFARPREISVRMYNTGYKPTGGALTMPFAIKNASEADMLDRPIKKLDLSGGGFQFTLSPFKVATYLVGVDSPNNRFAPCPAPEKPIGADYVRYWETNQNVAPEGFAPVTVVLEPLWFSDDRTAMRVRVTAASNLKDKNVKGKVSFQIPGGAYVEGDVSYELNPLEVKTFDLDIKGLNSRKLSAQYISARIEFGGRAYEDVLTFSDWKVLAGDMEKAETSVIDDSGWETLPLARFWSKGIKQSGTIWYRRKFFVPKGIADVQMNFERAKDAEIFVYINGREVRHEKWGVQYAPTIDRSPIKLGEENLIAIKLICGGSDEPAWGTAFKGSEALFNTKGWRYEQDSVKLEPGAKGSISLVFDNPFDQEVDGSAILISPIETWREGGPYSLIRISPTIQNYTLKPGERGKVAFDVAVPPGAMPGRHVAAVKIVHKGIVQYTDTIEIIIE